MDIIPITNFLRIHGMHGGEEFKNGVAIAFREGGGGLEYLVAANGFESGPAWIQESAISKSYVLKPATD